MPCALTGHPPTGPMGAGQVGALVQAWLADVGETLRASDRTGIGHRDAVRLLGRPPQQVVRQSITINSSSSRAGRGPTVTGEGPASAPPASVAR